MKRPARRGVGSRPIDPPGSSPPFGPRREPSQARGGGQGLRSHTPKPPWFRHLQRRRMAIRSSCPVRRGGPGTQSLGHSMQSAHPDRLKTNTAVTQVHATPCAPLPSTLPSPAAWRAGANRRRLCGPLLDRRCAPPTRYARPRCWFAPGRWSRRTRTPPGSAWPRSAVTARASCRQGR